MTENQTINIVYDGDCPFCKRYVKFVRLKETLGDVKLINARDSEHPIVQTVLEQGLDLDEGMAVLYGDKIYHGAEAVNALTLMSTPSTAFNKLMRLFFTNKTASKGLYPFLRLGRNMALFFKGKPQLKKHYKSPKENTSDTS